MDEDGWPLTMMNAVITMAARVAAGPGGVSGPASAPYIRFRYGVSTYYRKAVINFFRASKSFNRDASRFSPVTISQGELLQSPRNFRGTACKQVFWDCLLGRKLA